MPVFIKQRRKVCVCVCVCVCVVVCVCVMGTNPSLTSLPASSLENLIFKVEFKCSAD